VHIVGLLIARLGGPGTPLLCASFDQHDGILIVRHLKAFVQTLLSGQNFGQIIIAELQVRLFNTLATQKSFVTRCAFLSVVLHGCSLVKFPVLLEEFISSFVSFANAVDAVGLGRSIALVSE
jgi:hypothetical protein